VHGYVSISLFCKTMNLVIHKVLWIGFRGGFSYLPGSRPSDKALQIENSPLFQCWVSTSTLVKSGKFVLCFVVSVQYT
jgi:hypothetical protein